MADIFDVVSDGTRRRLLRALLDRSLSAGEVSVGELVGELGLSQPTVSKHLKVLRDHGLVAVREEGQHRFYRIDAEPLAELEEWLAPFRGIRPLQDRPSGATALAAPGAAPPWIDEAGDQAIGWSIATSSAEAVGRAAATLAHTARTRLHAWQLGVEVIERRVGQGYRRTVDSVARLVDRLPFG